MFKLYINQLDGTVSISLLADQAALDAWLAANPTLGYQIVTLDQPGYTKELQIQAQAYLDSTDWFVVRFAETGIVIPDDVKAKRAASRLIINPPKAV